MRQSPHLQKIIRPLVEYRFVLSLGFSAACGIVLNTLFPINESNALLRLIAYERPPFYFGLIRSYDLFLYTTPFLMFSMIFSLLYVHLYRSEQELSVGALPPYSDPYTRTELSLVLGEVHRQLIPKPSPAPQWLSIPERGLYTGIASFGSIGSGKTYGLILPAMRQLFAYRADDPARRLSGIVLEVKGDLCRQLQRILKWCGREKDYVEVSLDGDIRYNPLNNTLDAYAQAFNIASIITSIWGKGKEPFWQQSYTDLVRYVILLHRIRDGYLTMVDLFRTVISAGRLEDMLTEIGSRFSTASYIGIGKDEYREHDGLLSPSRQRNQVPQSVIRVSVMDADSPILNLRLPDGSRLAAMIPPVVNPRPLMTIRKFTTKSLRLDDLIRVEMLTQDQAATLTDAVREGQNILIAGGTASGKSTLLGTLADAIPDRERILLIEDTAELHIRKPHVVSAESQTDTHHSRITFDDVLRAILRHHPDRIIVGEVRGPEALTLLDATNTGHRGTLATIHASSAEEAIRRLASLAIRSAANLQLNVAEEDVRRGINLIVYITRHEGKRRVETVLRIRQ